MIQRIQSLYLFISAVATLLIFSFPIFIAELNETTSLLVGGSRSVMLSTDGAELDFASHIYVPILAGLAALVSIGTIFLFKNRPVQMKLARFASLLNTGLLVAILFFAVDGAKQIDSVTSLMGDKELTGSYQIGGFLPIIGMILCFLASRAIMKDEAMVRSADRLR